MALRATHHWAEVLLGQIKRTVLLADALEAFEIAGIAAEENPPRAVNHHPRTPQRLVAIEQATPGKVLGRRGNKANPVHFSALPPIQLPHLAGIHTPLDQRIAHAQGREEIAGLVRQLHHGLVVQVVVVIVGKDYRLDRRQVFKADRRLVETLGAGPTERRCALGEHRVGQPKLAAHFQQYSGVPKAEHAVVGSGEQLLTGQRLHRDLTHRPRAAGLLEKHLPHDAQGLAQAAMLDGLLIGEVTLLLFGRLGR